MNTLPRSNARSLQGRRFAVFAVLVFWLLSIIFLGSLGAFAAPDGEPPFAIVLGVAIPLACFSAAYRLSEYFREFVLSADLRFVAGIQAWRVV